MKRLSILLPLLLCGCHRQPSIVGTWAAQPDRTTLRSGGTAVTTKVMVFNSDGTFSFVAQDTADGQLRWEIKRTGSYKFDGKNLLTQSATTAQHWDASGALVRSNTIPAGPSSEPASITHDVLTIFDPQDGGIDYVLHRQ